MKERLTRIKSKSHNENVIKTLYFRISSSMINLTNGVVLYYFYYKCEVLHA